MKFVMELFKATLRCNDVSFGIFIVLGASASLLVTSASLLGARTLLGAPSLTIHCAFHVLPLPLGHRTA